MFALKSLALLMACMAVCQQVLAFRYIPCRLNAAGAIPKSSLIDVCKDATGDHCAIKRGASVNFNMAFQTVRPFEKATLRVSDVDMISNYQVFDSVDVCADAGLKCPSDEGDKQSMSKTLEFNKDFPTGFRNCRFELLDENEEPIMCQQFLAYIE